MRSEHVRAMRVVLLFLVVAMVAAACSSSDDAATTTAPSDAATTTAPSDAATTTAAQSLSCGDESAEITIWFGREEFIPDDAFEAFRAEYPNIQVNADVVPLEQIPADFIRVYGSDGAPDIIQPDNAQVAGLSARGLLLDVTSILEAWEDQDPDLYGAMTPTAWEMASYEGTPYGLALHFGVFWNIYRNDVLDELGLSLPETWDDVLEVGKQVSDSGLMWGMGLNASADQTPEWDKNIFAQMGGEWIDDVMQIDSEAGHYWLRFYQRAISEGVVEPATIALNWPDLIKNFSQGNIASALISRNVYTPAIEPEIAYGDEWLVNPVPYTRPGAESDARYITNGWPYFVSADTEYPCEVGLVLRYLADDAQSLSVAVRYQPVSNGRVMASDAYFDAAPWGPDLVEPWAKLQVRPFHVNESAMNIVIRDAMQEALTNPTADVAEMAARYQAELDALADEVSDG